MAITAKMVKELRDTTGAGMKDCKNALVEVDGDMQKAIEYLQIKGIAKAAKKSSRVAAEGLVVTYVDESGKNAAMVEVNCETDFVANTDKFADFANAVAVAAVAAKAADLDALNAAPMEDGTVDSVRNAQVLAIGENISIRRVSFVSLSEPGVVGTYIHGGGSHGCMTVLKTSADVDVEALAALGRDLCMHVTASKPLYVSESDIEEERVETERRILTKQALESGKPAAIVDKMITGRLKKWRKEICLVDQPFVKNPDLSVAQEVARVGKELGVDIAVESFLVFTRGEGIEKKESNLAEEVAAFMK